MTFDYQDEDVVKAPRSERAAQMGLGQARKRVVVTGAAGFIGSHLVESLLGSGCEVVGVDNFDPWYDPRLKSANLADATQHRRFSLFVDDLGQSDLAALFDGADVVFHLAARPGVQDSWGSGFADTDRLNVGLTQRVFEAASVGGVGRVVYASSSSVYGDGAGRESRSVEPISPYGVSKAAGEQLAHVYGRTGLDVVSLRYFTVYGPRQRPDMAMHRLIAAVGPSPRPFERRGSGRQRREFTYVADVAAATAAVGFSDNPDLPGSTLDIGGGCGASLNEVIDAVRRIAGQAPVVVDHPPAPGDPGLTVADIEPVCRLIGWRPSTDLMTGLRNQWRWQTGGVRCRPVARFPLDIGENDDAAGEAIGQAGRTSAAASAA